ncbi:MAG: response regulator [Gammaproteobacteria bacterium]|nr:response regulator [Gammaproteobacteria bacterium]
MRVLYDISIKYKLSAIIILTSGIVLLLASAAFITNEVYTFRRGMVADLFAIADLTGINSSATLLFDDRKVAKENLRSLKVKPHIVSAHLFSKDGELFASYFKEGADGRALPSHSNIKNYYFPNLPAANADDAVQDNHFFHDDYLELFKQIIFKGDILGTVYIRSDLEKHKASMRWYAGIAGIVMLASLFVAVLLASRLQQIITAPIYRLLKTMKAVSAYKNYSIREEKTADDELGALIGGFNDMLTQVEMRDKELGDYRDHLQEMVVTRTAELAEARDQALAASKAKSIFLANMSHEIRTPMNAVLGYTQILRRDSVLTKEQRNSLQIIENSGNHLLALINDILDISKIEAGAMELREEVFSLCELMEGIAAIFRIRCEQKNLNWRVENAINESMPIYGDQGKLRQILINLLGNAVKFTETGEVVLRVTPQEDAYYQFDVIDTGPGISQTFLTNIFEPFSTGEIGFDRGGTGLGLAISKRQVEFMGGTLRVASEPGKGACFSVRLRLPKIQADIALRMQKCPEVLHLASGLCVSALVVDDVEENRNILCEMLRGIGVDVYEASNGRNALDKIHEKQPDIIFSDICMPVMDGIELINHIHNMYSNEQLPCVAITASTLEHQNLHVLNAGFDAFIPKPFNFDAIYASLKRFLRVEFEYKLPEEAESMEKSLPAALDFSEISLPKQLYEHLSKAAALNELTELEEIILELQAGNAQQQILAGVFQKFLEVYNIDGIEKALEKISYAEY